ncbi:hypothetical protein ILYODFUR_032614 [Ilyodon furcidens]|uniref:Uncharacterized protein n=1 Tax=Ilyodon furcidens TaxID=33524 RepID=A0ABV0UPY1_9TELE
MGSGAHLQRSLGESCSCLWIPVQNVTLLMNPAGLKVIKQVVEVFQKLCICLDAINFPRLQATSTKPRHVAASSVLLAQQ